MPRLPSPPDSDLSRWATGRSHHAGHVLAQLRHGARDLGREHIAEGGEGALLSAHELVAAADELDELARVDVWIATVLNVLDQFWGYVWEDRLLGFGGGVDF